MKPIKKIKTTTVETFLDIELTPNKTVLGVDVSMHSTGLALIRTTETYLVIEKLDVIKVPKKVKSFLSSADSFLEQLDQIKREIISYINLTKVVIEDCFFGSNVKTLNHWLDLVFLYMSGSEDALKKAISNYPQQQEEKLNLKSTDKKIKGTKT